MSRAPLSDRPELNSYSRVASEYYDAELHPTCRNFRDASRFFLRAALLNLPRKGWAVEIGAGDSLAGELGQTTFEKLVLLDSSEEMLSYSKKFQDFASLVIGNALALPFSDSSISLIVASLADPFNVCEFWNEVYRTLKVGAHCIFTSPSHEWASSFRQNSTGEHEGAALFQLANGEHVYLPSLVQPQDSQIEMIRQAGLRLVAKKNITADAIPKPHSSKIAGCNVVVSGFVVQRV
jgi:hypothetical protein